MKANRFAHISYDDFGSTEMPPTIFRVTSAARTFIRDGKDVSYVTCASHHATGEDAAAEMDSRDRAGHTDITLRTYVRLAGEDLPTLLESLKQLVEPPAV